MPHVPYAIDCEPEGQRRVLLERVPDGSDVLDVGCWAGWAGRFLIDARSATVDGVEPVNGMAQIAGRDYRHVLVSPIEEAAQILRDRGDRYQVLLFLDVLEHLVDPRAVLSQSRHLVAPGGRALISVPNVAHWSVRKQLLRGHWRYEDSGLLDRTHLRFFTIETARELLEQAGWAITWESSSPGQPPLLRLGPRTLASLRAWPGLFAVQLLYEAVPADARLP